MEPLSEREMKILVAYANGRTSSSISNTMLLSMDQVCYSRNCIYRKLRVTSRRPQCMMAEAVAIAWRLCILNGDDIEGRVGADQIDIDFEIRSSLHKMDDKPKESWPELRERARRIAAEYRARKALRADRAA